MHQIPDRVLNEIERRRSSGSRAGEGGKRGGWTAAAVRLAADIRSGSVDRRRDKLGDE